MSEEQQQALPDNVGAAMHPENKNYIMFTTFDGTNPDDDDILDLPNYKEALKKVVTVMEYEYFQSLVEAVEGDVSQAGKMFYLPQSIRPLDQLPAGLAQMIQTNCADYGDNTLAILRFFEFDKETDSYAPVDVQFDEDGHMLQHNPDEEE